MRALLLHPADRLIVTPKAIARNSGVIVCVELPGIGFEQLRDPGEPHLIVDWWIALKSTCYDTDEIEMPLRFIGQSIGIPKASSGWHRDDSHSQQEQYSVHDIRLLNGRRLD